MTHAHSDALKWTKKDALCCTLLRVVCIVLLCIVWLAQRKRGTEPEKLNNATKYESLECKLIRGCSSVLCGRFVYRLFYRRGSVFLCGSPVTQRASLGLNNAEVPQGQVPAWISLPVAIHLNSQRSLR